MKKNILFAVLFIAALPTIILAQQNVINFDSIMVGRYDTVPAILASKGLVICHGDNENINPCSNGYHNALKMSSASDSVTVGKLSQSTSVTARVSGNDSPGMSLMIEASPNKYGPYSAVNFIYSPGGPCYTVITDMIDQGYYIRFRAINGKIVRIFWIQSDNGLLPVELVSFSAIRLGDNVKLNWQTKTETNNYGFGIEKYINNNWEQIDFVVGHGTVNTPQNYSYIDPGTGQAEIKYRLKQIDRDGKFKYSNPITVLAGKDKLLSILQASPNPFNPATTIYYNLPKNENISMIITNMRGEIVSELVKNENKIAGNYSIVFNANNLPSGTYFVWLRGSRQTMLRIQLTK